MKEPKLTKGESEIIRADGFEKGVCSTKFKLGKEFSISKSESTASLHIISSKSIYYETSDGMNILVVKEGARVPYYSQVQTWGNDAFPNNELNAVIDLRTSGLYGPEFNPNKLNDGRGNFGEAFFIDLTPIYYVYYNKENAQEEIKNRINKIKGLNTSPANWALENILNATNAEEKALREEFKAVKEEYKQFNINDYKAKSKEVQFLASIADAVKSEFSSDVKVLMVKDIVKRYDRN